MPRIRVMVVEDDDFTRSTVVSALQIQGVDVVCQTGSIGPAMRLAQELKPDAVIVDLDLGAGPTGIDLAIALRRKFPRMGIVILTTFEDPRLLNPKIPDPPTGTEYLVKRTVGDIELLYKGIQKAINNVSKSTPSNRGEKHISPELANVTDSQLETMRLVAQGKSNSEIAKIRGVSEKSIEQSISRLVSNLDLPKGNQSNQRVQISKLYFGLTGSKSARNE
jgi:DNA-binding NarL/FixJ family response regulator